MSVSSDKDQEQLRTIGGTWYHQFPRPLSSPASPHSTKKPLILLHNRDTLSKVLHERAEACVANHMYMSMCMYMGMHMSMYMCMCIYK